GLADGAVAPHGGELVGGQQPGVVIFPHATRVGIDDVLEVGDAVGERQELVDLLFVLGEHQSGFAIAQEIGGFLVQHVAIEAEAHGADGMGGDFGRHPVRPVVADDADNVAAAEPELDQAEREVVHPRLVVIPGEGFPEPEILFAQSDLAAMLAGVEPQQFWISIGLRDPPGVIHHAAHSGAAGLSSGSTRTSSSSPRYARFTWGSASTEAGSPSAILRPKSSTMTRCEISITTPMSCSIIITVMPNSSLRSTM